MLPHHHSQLVLVYLVCFSKENGTYFLNLWKMCLSILNAFQIAFDIDVQVVFLKKKRKEKARKKETKRKLLMTKNPHHTLDAMFNPVPCRRNIKTPYFGPFAHLYLANASLYSSFSPVDYYNLVNVG